MKKSLYVVIAVLVLGIVALYFTGSAVLGKVATAGVQAFVPQVTKTPVTLEGVSVSPLTGSGTAKGFVLGNPEGFKSDFAISFGEAHLDVAPFSILGDRVLIEKIHVSQPRFNYERKLLTSNIKQIMKNVEAASGRPVEDAEDVPEEFQETSLKIEIRELIIEEGQVSFSMVGANTVPVPLPRIVLRDIGTDAGGIAPDEMAFEVMSVVLGQVLGAVAKAPGSAIKGIGNIFTGGDDEG